MFEFDDIIFMRNPMLPFATSISQISENLANVEPIFREAIFLASNDLYDQIKDNEAINLINDTDKIIASLQKYALRMSCRSTPFGLFSTFSEVEWSDNMTIAKLATRNLKRWARLDMTQLHYILTQILNQKDIRKHFSYTVNNSIYYRHNEIKYVETDQNSNFQNYKISILRSDESLSFVLNLAKDGAKFMSLVDSLIDQGFPLDESQTYIERLIDEGILINEISLKITSGNIIEDLIFQLKTSGISKDSASVSDFIDILSRINNKLNKLNGEEPNSISTYAEIEQILKDNFTFLSTKRLFQVDTQKQSVTGTLNKQFQQKILDALDLFARFSHNNTTKNLQDFINKFKERYEDRSIALSEAVDGEIGIGYPVNKKYDSKLISGISLKSQEQNRNIELNLKDQFLLKMLASLNGDEKEIEIKKSSIEKFEPNYDSFPDTFIVFFNVLYNNAGGASINIKGISSRSAGSLIGRFSHTDKFVYKLLARINEHEQNCNNDKINAEIVHLPPMVRMGNVLTRNHSRKYEIPYLTSSNRSKDYQIPVSDLYLKVVSNKLVLFSKTKGKEIVTYLSSAQNFSNLSLPAYQLLCDIQNNGKTIQGFSWGNLTNLFSYFPRVRYEDMIISPETWLIDNKNLKIKTISDLTRIIGKHTLPSIFLLCDDDNELLINLNDDKLVTIFLKEVSKKEFFIIKESLFTKDNTFFAQDEQSSLGYCNELLTSVYKAKDFTKANAISISAINKDIKYLPGQNWLYFKFYCSSLSANKFILGTLAPLLKELIKKKLMDRYFFIRYRDPEYHIRLRINLIETKDISAIFSCVNKYMQASLKKGFVNKVLLDTYLPEIDRYGINNMETIEDYFYHDSNLVLQLLQKSFIEESLELSVMYAIDLLLDMASFTLHEKKTLLNILSISFGNEHDQGKPSKILLDKRYRRVKGKLMDVLSNSDKDFVKSYSAIFTRHVKVAKPTIDSIVKQLKKDNKSKYSVFGDLIHMTCNRVFSSSQRTHEYVIYTYLVKMYTTQEILFSKKKLNPVL